MINSIFNLLCEKKIITVNTEDEKEIYLFALDVIVYTFINIIVILTISLFINSFLISVLFLLLFSILQTTGGGYHASSHIGCIISTVSTWLLYIFLDKYIIVRNSAVIAIITLLCIGIILYITPIEHPNAPITKKQYKKHKIRVYKLFLILFLIQIILFFTFSNIFSLICYIIILYFLSVMIAFFIQKIKKKEPPL